MTTLLNYGRQLRNRRQTGSAAGRFLNVKGMIMRDTYRHRGDFIELVAQISWSQNSMPVFFTRSLLGISQHRSGLSRRNFAVYFLSAIKKVDLYKLIFPVTK